MWKWWYKNCTVQQVFMIISGIVGLLVGVYAILLGTLKLHETGFDHNDVVIKIINKYRFRIIIWMIVSFIVSFVINNLILVKYCDMNTKGAKNVIFSLLLLFGVVPTINSITTYLLGAVMLLDVIKEIKNIQM